MATYTSAQSGNWSDGSTWVGGVKPPANAGHKIIVAAGHNVTYNETSSTYGDDTTTGITINGVLVFARNQATELICRGTLVIGSTGLLDMGTQADPVNANCVIRLNDSATLAANKYNLNKLANGRVTTCGVTRTRRASLTATCASGATSIQVNAATGWQIGDELLLCPTAQVAAASAANLFQVVTIGAGYTPGALTVPISAASLMSRAVGGRVCNLTSNVRITEANNGFPAVANFGTDNIEDGVLLRNTEFRLRGEGFNASVRVSNTFLSGGYRAKVIGCVVRSDGGSVASRTLLLNAGSYAEDCVLVQQSSSGSASNLVSPVGGIVKITAASFGVTNLGQSTWGSGINNTTPAPGGPTEELEILSPGSTTGTFQGQFLQVQATHKRLTFAHLLTGSTSGVLTLFAPGTVFEECDFAPMGDTTRPLFGTNPGFNGTVVIKSSRLPDILPSYTFGGNVGFYAFLLFCYRYSTPGVIVNELWANGGSAVQTTVQRKNATHGWEFETRAAGALIDHSFTAPIAAGQTRTLKVQLRRDSTYGSGSMPKVSLSVPGLTTVSTTAPDVADTWHEQTISITNTTGLSSEVTVKLETSGPTVGGKAWFSGIPVQPFIPAVRWYGQVFDEANPFRVADPTITLTESAAAAVTGVAINHTAQTITVTAARTAAEVYCYCMLDLVNNLATSGDYRTRHITSSDGASFATTYTVVIGSGGSISGRYSDANGAVVAATVSNIVTGSRILIVRTDTSAVLANAVVGGTSYSFNIQTASAIPISVDVRKGTAAPFYQPWSTTGSIDPVGGFTATANQQID